MNKRKKILIGSGSLLLILGIAAVAYGLNNMDDTKQSSQSVRPITQTACELLTLDDAKAILGDTASVVRDNKDTTTVQEKNTPPPVAEVKTDTKPSDGITSSALEENKKADNSETASCSYVWGQSGTTRDSITITVLSLDSASAKANFESMKTADARQVSEYGEKAFWRSGKDMSGAAEYGQLVILQKGGVVTIAGSKSDLGLSKKIAKTVEGNLHD